MSDDPLTRAVLSALAQDANAAQALAFTDEFKRSPDAWREALRRLFLPAPHEAVRFYYFQVLQHAVAGGAWAAISDADRALVRASLLQFVAEHVAVRAPPPYIKVRHTHRFPTSSSHANCPFSTLRTVYFRHHHILAPAPTPPTDQNALASLLLRIAALDFPHAWPTFFHDLLQRMPLGTEVIDLVLRVLAALDDEVVQQDQQRTAADVARCAALKDGMRDSGAGSWSHAGRMRDFETGKKTYFLISSFFFFFCIAPPTISYCLPTRIPE